VKKLPYLFFGGPRNGQVCQVEQSQVLIVLAGTPYMQQDGRCFMTSVVYRKHQVIWPDKYVGLSIPVFVEESQLDGDKWLYTAQPAIIDSLWPHGVNTDIPDGHWKCGVCHHVNLDKLDRLDCGWCGALRSLGKEPGDE